MVRRGSALVKSLNDSERGDRFETVVHGFFSEHGQPGEGSGGVCCGANIHAKRKRIAAGSGEKMRKPGSKGAPTAANFKRAAKTAKRNTRRG